MSTVSPCKGKLNKKQFQAFCKFFMDPEKNPRRTFKDCLDNVMVVDYLRQFAANHTVPDKDRTVVIALMATKLVLLFTIAFRFFNRLSSLIPLKAAWNHFRTSDTEPPWQQLEKELADNPAPLFKQFAHPPDYKTVQESAEFPNIVEDLAGREDADVALIVNMLKEYWRQPAFSKAAELLHQGLNTRHDWTRLVDYLVELHGSPSLKGTFGEYRQKGVLDIIMAHEISSASNVSKYPVAVPSGTSLSLGKLYGIKVSSPTVASQLLSHLMLNVQVLPGIMKYDCQATLSFLLCGWHRSKSSTQFDGRKMSVLQRCVLVEDPIC